MPWTSRAGRRVQLGEEDAVQLVEDPSLLPPLQPAPAGLPGAEPQLQRQELPGHVVIEDVQDALQTQPVRHRPRPRRPRRPGRQQRFDQCPQRIVHDPRPSAHAITNGRIVTPVTADQRTSTRSCYELLQVRGLIVRHESLADSHLCRSLVVDT